MRHRIYYSPGIFGFGRLASYDYFEHVERALEARFQDAGVEVTSTVVGALPTASVRRRAARLAEVIDTSCGEDRGPIHLLGHSTGGLDGRLVASPSAVLPVRPGVLGWLPRLRSVTTMNTPHYGTPLAKFFATVSGQRILYALSALTFTGLSIGAPPLALAGALVGLIRRAESSTRLEQRALDRAVASLIRVLGDAGSLEVRDFLDAIKQDQGAVLQLTPESMDLFQAGVEDRAGVVYQSTVSMSPSPSARTWLAQVPHPWTVLSMSIFTTLHGITGRADRRYPCAGVRAPAEGAEPELWAGDDTEARLAAALGEPVTIRANDGVVPLRSQLWGRVVWAGLADHLDVLGHFRGDRIPTPPALRHRDWLTSGSSFDRPHFDALIDAIATGMLAAAGAVDTQEPRLAARPAS
jgi:hypothetical protein